MPVNLDLVIEVEVVVGILVVVGVHVVVVVDEAAEVAIVFLHENLYVGTAFSDEDP